ncbi:MAG: signal peptidase II [Candidatus Puniceispirillaceae bacterium]|jgi:signal peptidase II|nr:signal peptidase II [Pseudomonadota bacterium]
MMQHLPAIYILIRFFVIAGIVLALDMVTKQMALSTIFATGQPVQVTPFLNFAPVWNEGVSFGLFADYPQITNMVVPVFALFVIGWLITELTESGWVQQIGAGLICGGANGNIVDRFRFNKVVDFIDVHVAGLHWPAFNIADASIFIGVILWLYAMMFLNVAGDTAQD